MNKEKDITSNGKDIVLEKITPLEKDFSAWFTDVVTKGNLIEYGLVKGTIVFKPLSFGMWENIQKNLNKMINNVGGKNVVLPLLIPQRNIEKEKKHVKGFEPELATVTKIGNRELEEHYVIRPTSEVAFGALFHKEVRSYNDLPIIYNQWVNVVRWEKKTKPFLRTSEFLWQEGHSVHANAEQARKLTKKIIHNYAKFCRDYLAIPTIEGKKTPLEKFAGAVTTYTIESIMKNGKALQTGTSHYLGQNFSDKDVFNIAFTDKLNQEKFAYQTSWGVSTRLIGAVIMVHGDNHGIIMPPKIATYQIDILEILNDKDPKVSLEAQKIYNSLKNRYRVRIDKSDKSPGFKASNSEIQGVPLRIEVGPRDLKNQQVLVVRRDTFEKSLVKMSELKKTILIILQDIHNNLLKNAQKNLENNIVKVSSYEEFKKQINLRKFVLAPFDGKEKEECDINNETRATARCIPFKYKLRSPEQCIITNRKTKRLVLFAKAY